jgi:hypothetical protein
MRGKFAKVDDKKRLTPQTLAKAMSGLDDTNSRTQAYCMRYNLKENNPTILLRVIIGSVVITCSRRNWANNEHLN